MSDSQARARSWPILAATMAASLGALALPACGTDQGNQGGDRTVLVFAAASLTDVMVEVERAFEAVNPDIDVEINLGGSASLRAQILEGAPADVVATANPAIMQDLVDAGQVVSRPETLATNRLVVAVAPGNPAGVDGLADLGDPAAFVGLCAPEVPCGMLADRTLVAAGVEVEPDSREADVRSLLTKIEAGELDAGLVYATDVTASTAGVEGIELPPTLAATTDYPIAVVAGTSQPEAAQAFTTFAVGAEGRRILAQHGFETP